MGLEFSKPIEWAGAFVALEDCTFKDTITLSSEDGKEATKDYQSGGILFQGVKKIEKELKITKLKFMLENVKEIKDKVIIKGGAIGSIRNCQDFDSLDCSENVELRLINSNVKKTVKIDTGHGEIVSTKIEDKTTINKSGFFISDSILKDFDTNDSFLNMNKITIGKITAENNIFNISKATTDDMKIKSCNMNVYNIDAKKVDIEESSIQASILSSTNIDLEITTFCGADITLKDSGEYKSNNSTSNILSLNGDVTLNNSAMDVQAFGGSASVDSTSSLIALTSEVSVSSTGAVLLLNSSTSISVNDHGFIGIGCNGVSNFSGIAGGVDIMAVERINNRTSSDFIADAGGSVYIHAADSVYSMADSQLLNQSGSDMNLVAGSTQLLKGQMVYVVGATIPQFSPADHCVADDCKKPVWVEGGTGQSVNGDVPG